LEAIPALHTDRREDALNIAVITPKKFS
jgi:hypothetical protein